MNRREFFAANAALTVVGMPKEKLSAQGGDLNLWWIDETAEEAGFGGNHRSRGQLLAAILPVLAEYHSQVQVGT